MHLFLYSHQLIVSVNVAHLPTTWTGNVIPCITWSQYSSLLHQYHYVSNNLLRFLASSLKSQNISKEKAKLMDFFNLQVVLILQRATIRSKFFQSIFPHYILCTVFQWSPPVKMVFQSSTYISETYWFLMCWSWLYGPQIEIHSSF